MYDKIVNYALLILNCISWVATICLIISRKKQQSDLLKKAQNEDLKILQNKNNQKEKEKNDMANFLCDRCGKQVPVAHGCAYNSAHTGEHFDLCGECFQKLNERDGEIARALQDYNAALEKLAQNKAALLEAVKGLEGEKITPPYAEEAKVKAAEPIKDDVPDIIQRLRG